MKSIESSENETSPLTSWRVVDVAGESVPPEGLARKSHLTVDDESATSRLPPLSSTRSLGWTANAWPAMIAPSDGAALKTIWYAAPTPTAKGFE